MNRLYLAPTTTSDSPSQEPPCLTAVRDQINERCRAMNTHALLESFTLEKGADDWTLVIGIQCANGERLQFEVDLVDLMVEAGYLQLSEVLH